MKRANATTNIEKRKSIVSSIEMLNEASVASVARIEPSGLAFGKPKDELREIRDLWLPDFGAARLNPGYARSAPTCTIASLPWAQAFFGVGYYV